MSDDERPDNVTPIKGNGNGAHGPERLRLVHLSRARVRAINWLVRGWIERDVVLDVIGDPSAGKSLLLLDLSLCIATGTPWNGIPVERGPVVYIAGEGHSGLARRRAAWEIEHGITLDESMPLFVSTMETGLTDMREKAHLLTTLETFNVEHGVPAFVVIDTLARNFGPGDENDTVSMNAAAATLHAIRRTCIGSSVATVHHTGIADKTRARGSGALKGATDHEFLVTKSVDHLVELKALKMRDSEYPEPIGFRFKRVDLGLLDHYGLPVTSAVLEPTGEPIISTGAPQFPERAPMAGSGKNQTTALAVLQSEYERHRRNKLTSGHHPDSALVMRDVWRMACMHAGIAPNRFPDAERALQKRGVVIADGAFVRLREDVQPWQKMRADTE